MRRRESGGLKNGHHTWLTRLLEGLAGFVIRYPRPIIGVQLLLFVLSIAYTVLNLEFFTDRNSLVGSDKEYHKYFLAYKKEFRALDDMVVVVESGSPEKNRLFIETLGARLKTEPGLFRQIFYRRDLEALGSKAMWFMEPGQIDALYRQLEEIEPRIRPFLEVTNLHGLFEQMNQQFRDAWRQSGDGSGEGANILGGISTVAGLLNQARKAMELDVKPVGPSLATLISDTDQAVYDQYIHFEQGRFFLLSVQPAEKELESEAIKRLRVLVSEIKLNIAGLNVGVTGEGILEQDEMKQSQSDSLRASILALILVSLIFIFGFHEISRPLKATFCLLVGLAYTMAYTTLVVGHLNILTITFAPILIGLAIDFGIHIVSRFEEERLNGQEVEMALRLAIVYTGQGILSGGLTTAGAFGVMTLTEFQGIKEMGAITGGGMLMSLIPMMTLLPAMLVWDKKRPQPEATVPGGQLAKVSLFWVRKPGWVIGGCLFLCLVGAVKLSDVRFDYNLLNMQSAGLPAVEYEKRLIESSEKSVLFAAVVADTLEEAVEKAERLNALPRVASVDTMAVHLVKDEALYRPGIARVKHLAESLVPTGALSDSIQLEELDHALWILSGYVKQALPRLDREDAEQAGIFDNLTELLVAIREFRQELGVARDSPVKVRRLGQFQVGLFDEIRRFFVTLASQDASHRPRVEDLPEALRDRFMGRTGKFLIQVYPRENVWERGPQEAFIREVRSVDPRATGTPVQLYEYTTLLRESYEHAAVYALIAIALLVLIQFRSFVGTFLSLIPVFVGGLWMVGFMGWFNIPFNPANIMTLPLVVGIGVTNGIHVLVRFREEGSVDVLSKSTGKAVLASALTTVSGFGSLVFSDHQGIASLGWVMSIGVLTCMVAGLTLLPACLAMALRFKWRLKA